MRRTGVTQENTEAWVKLYNEGKSIRDIAKEYNVAKTCVSRAIKPFVKIRPKSPFLKYGEEWVKLYIAGETKADIAREYNTSPTVVGNILEKMGVDKNTTGLKYEHLEETFEEMYTDGKSLSEIGERFGIDKQTILNYLNRNGVEVRDLSEASRSIPFNESYFDELTPEKRFILGIIYRIGNVVYDGDNPRHIKIMSQSKECIQYIQRKIDRDKDGRISIQEGKYYFDDIHSIKFISKITEFGFRAYNNFSLPEFSNEELDELFDGYFYPHFAFGVQYKSRKFSFPSPEVKRLVLDYFERKEMFSKTDIRKETDTSFIIQRKSFNLKASEYYPELPSKYARKNP